MNPLILYLIKASISLAIFYGFYALIYRKEAFFNFNRAFLLLTLLTSTALPFFSFSVFSFSESGVQSPEDMLYYMQLPMFQMNEAVVNSSDSVVDSFSLILYIVFIYLGVVIFKSVQFLLRLKQIANISNRNKNTFKDGVRFIFTDNGLPVFSFFNQIFINENVFKEQDAEKIIEHEKIHIKQFHSIDLILVELVCILQWFNPFAYFLKKAIKENHEFIADQQIVSKQHDDSAYRLLLLEYATPIKTNILVHNFSYSLLKRRLNMMKKRKSMTHFAFNLFWIVPVLFLVLFACSSPNIENTMSGNEMNKNGELNTEGSSDVLVSTFIGEEGVVFFLLRITKERHIKFDVIHEDGTLVTLLDDIQVPDTNGAVICNYEGPNKVYFKPGKYTYKVIADYKKMTSGRFSAPMGSSAKSSDDSDKVFPVVEQQPEFPGGISKLYSYLGKTVKYPAQAKRDSIVGRVFVSFVVEKDGAISNVKLLRGIGGGCDKEAMRVVSEMPNWKPGLMKGQAVRVQYNLPIKFVLK